MVELKSKKILVGIVVGLALLATAILVPLSLSYVEYYQYGLAKRKATGTVNVDKVYSAGRYMLGVTRSFITYQADAHYVEFEELSVFSAGESNSSIGLTFMLDIDLTYFLKEAEVGLLHKELAGSYREVVKSRTRDAIKNEAIFVSFTEYFQDRSSVEKRFREAVQKRWDASPSVHCTLDQFHLGRIRIPDSVANKQLESRIQNERNDKEDFLQQAQIERELTAVDVNTILLEKDNALRTATAQANLTRAKANADASRLTAEAQINGTAVLFQAAGITNQDQKTSFTYIRTLANRDNVDMDVSYLATDSVVRTRAA